MPDPVRWGPDNPHPLSQMRKELVWDGKHIEYGRRRSVDVAGAAMPMQVHVGENSGEIEK